MRVSTVAAGRPSPRCSRSTRRDARGWAAPHAPVLAALALLAAPAAAREWRVAPGSALPTPQAALAVAADGDVVRVLPGVYRGPLHVTKRVRLVGVGLPVLDGGGHGTVVTLAARGAALEGFVVRGSGDSLDGSDAGIAVTGAGVRVTGNRLVDVLFGVMVDDAANTIVASNVIAGKALDIARRGDAIRIWHSAGARVEGNDAHDGRDVVLWYSDRLAVRRNHVTRSRYGLHFMFCDDADIESNLLAGNSVGAFLMYSRRLRFVRNTVADNDGPSGYGLGLKDMDDFQVLGNRFVGNRVGVFLDDSPRELGGSSAMTGNLFAGGEVGVRLLPNVERLAIEGNSFVENQQQVEVAGGGGDPAANRWRGNHWSDYAGYDAGGDGVGDVPYRSERLFEQVVDRRPALRFFLLSPATTAIDFAARAFPVFRPQAKLEDDAPRLAATYPPDTPALEPARGPRLSRPVGVGLIAGALLLLLPCVVKLRTAKRTRLDIEPRNPAMEPDRPLLQARGLCKRFGALQALDDVTFDLQAGETVALWGANGAGKTTLLRALLGAIPVDGTVRLGGHDVRRQGRKARRLVGFVPQEIAFPELTAGEALQLFAGLHGASQGRIDRLVERLDLGAELEKRVQTLSGGRKQRLALAIALVADPPLLLLDEPSSNLDVAARRELLGLLLELKAEGKALLFSSHRPEEVARLADRVLHLEGGRLLADAPPAEVLAAELADDDEPAVAAPPSRENAAKLLRFR